MRVDFLFSLGDQVTDIHEPGLFTGTVNMLTVDIGGEKLVYVADQSGAMIPDTKGRIAHHELDLMRAPSEPHFDLLAHDTLAAETVRFWVHLAEESGHVPKEKIDGAIKIADAMDAWPHHRLPD